MSRSKKMKTLIVYYSKDKENWVNGKKELLEKGNSQVAAEILHSLLSDSILREIKKKNPYSDEYDLCVNEAYKDQKEEKRPEILFDDRDFDSFERIFLCYPIYWETCPMPVLTFVKNHDFTNKDVYLLSTHEGSGLGSSPFDIQKENKTIQVKTSMPIIGSLVMKSEEEIASFLKRNGID